MLVLSRRPTEVITIGDNIRIKVVDVRGNKVRIGIDAPKHVRVDREEVCAAIQREQLAGGGIPEVVTRKDTAGSE